MLTNKIFEMANELIVTYPFEVKLNNVPYTPTSVTVIENLIEIRCNFIGANSTVINKVEVLADGVLISNATSNFIVKDSATVIITLKHDELILN